MPEKSSGVLRGNNHFSKIFSTIVGTSKKGSSSLSLRIYTEHVYSKTSVRTENTGWGRYGLNTFGLSCNRLGGYIRI